MIIMGVLAAQPARRNRVALYEQACAGDHAVWRLAPRDQGAGTWNRTPRHVAMPQPALMPCCTKRGMTASGLGQ